MSSFTQAMPTLTTRPVSDDESVEAVIRSRLNELLYPVLMTLCRSKNISPVPTNKAAMINELRALGWALADPEEPTTSSAGNPVRVDFEKLDNLGLHSNRAVLEGRVPINVTFSDGKTRSLSIPSLIAETLGLDAECWIDEVSYPPLLKAVVEILHRARHQAQIDTLEAEFLAAQAEESPQPRQSGNPAQESPRGRHNAIDPAAGTSLDDRHVRFATSTPATAQAASLLPIQGAGTSGVGGGLPPTFTSGTMQPPGGTLGGVHATTGPFTPGGTLGGVHTTTGPFTPGGPPGGSYATTGPFTLGGTPGGSYATMGPLFLAGTPGGSYATTGPFTSSIGSTTNPISIPAFPWSHNAPGALPMSGLSLPTLDTISQSCGNKWTSIQASHGASWKELIQSVDYASARCRIHTVNLLENMLKFFHLGVPAHEFSAYATAVLRELHRELFNVAHFLQLLTTTTDPALAAATKSNYKELKAISAAGVNSLPAGFLTSKASSTPKRATSTRDSDRTSAPDSFCHMHPNSFHTNADCDAQKKRKGGGPSGSSGGPTSGTVNNVKLG